MSEQENLSASLEHYLKAIYTVVQEKAAAKVRDIAWIMQVRSSSVTSALQSLSKKGLVNYTPYDIVTLTPEGTKIAMDIITRHQAIREFFVTVLSLDEEESEEAACQLEHIVSRKVLNRLINYVQYIETCPEGGVKWLDNKGYVCRKHLNDHDCSKCAYAG